MSDETQPISNAETLQAISSLSDESFVRQYVAYASLSTDAPLAFHLASALACLSAAAHEDLSIDEGLPGGPFYAPLWAVVVGRAANDRKTTAVTIARRVMALCSNITFGDVPETSAALVKELAGRNKQTLWMPDLGGYLEMLERQASARSLKGRFLEVFDGLPITKSLGTKSPTRVMKPRLTWLAAVNPALVASAVSPTDWEGGLMSRFFFMYAKREDTMWEMPDRGNRLAWLGSRMETLAESAPGRCVGLDTDAMILWRDWHRLQDERFDKIASLARQTAHGRVGLMALKIALLLAFDEGLSEDQTWRIPVDLLEVAISIAEFHYRSACLLADRCHPSRDMQERQRFLECLHIEHFISFGDALRASNLLKRSGTGILETLVEEGMVEQRFVSGCLMLRRKVPDVVGDDDEVMDEAIGRAGILQRARDIRQGAM